MPTIQQTYPQTIAELNRKWTDECAAPAGRRLILPWGPAEEQEVAALTVLAHPHLKAIMTEYKGGPNFDIELSYGADEPEVEFERIEFRYVGRDYARGEDYYDEDTETVYCDLKDLPQELDETVGCVTINLDALAAAEISAEAAAVARSA